MQLKVFCKLDSSLSNSSSNPKSIFPNSIYSWITLNMELNLKKKKTHEELEFNKLEFHAFKKNPNGTRVQETRVPRVFKKKKKKSTSSVIQE